MLLIHSYLFIDLYVEALFMMGQQEVEDPGSVQLNTVKVSKCFAIDIMKSIYLLYFCAKKFPEIH